jgi:pilus assembly protein Flp/PilA
MNRIVRHLQSFAADERGATVIEYCFIAGLVSIMIVAGATQIGQAVLAMLGKANTGLQ